MQKKENLKSNVIFESSNGNYYLQSNLNNSCVYLHPGLLKAMNFDKNESEKSHQDLYYKKKCEFLKRFYPPDESYSKKMIFKIDEQIVKRNLINIYQIVFEITDKCNLNCSYCGYGELYSGYDNRIDKNLSWDMAKQILDYFLDIWKKDIYPSINKPIAIGFYGGEPLLNFPLIIKITDYLEMNKPSDIEFTYHMTTNGLLLNKYMNELANKDVHLSISLDGDKNNNSYRLSQNNNNVWQNIMDNIGLIKSEFPKYFEKRVSFISVLHNRNSIFEILNFFKINFNKTPTILEVSSVGIKNDKKDEFYKIYSNKKKSIRNSQDIAKTQNELFIADPDTGSMKDYIFNFTNNVIKDYKYFFIDHNEISFFPTGTCLPFGKKMFITVNGKILPCERIDQKFMFGKIENNTVKINPKLIADSQSDYYDKISNQCISCYKNKFCLECIYSNESIFQKGRCENFMNLNNYKKYLSQIISDFEDRPKVYNRIMNEVIIGI